MVDPIECVHCGKTINIEYSACEDCCIIFKTIDGTPTDDSIVEVQNDFIDSIDSLIDMVIGCGKEILSEEDLSNLLDDLGGDVEVKEVRLTKGDSMSDYIHRCLKCNAISYEVSPGNYLCPECDFRWEIMKRV